MLDFSRKNDEIRSDCSINDLIEKAVSLASSDYDLKKHYDFKTIEILRNYSAELSPVSVVRNEIEQVFLNILKNSAQAISKEWTRDKSPRINLSTFENERWVTAEISDNGPGMSAEEQKRAFEPFFTTKSPGEGTGLGLSVSYFIITRNHKGEIKIASELDQGTTFIIRLPKQQIHSSG